MKQPREGTKIAQAVAFVRKRGAARTKEIAQAIECPATSVAALLKPYVESGLFVTCRVMVPGAPPQTEYRIGAGGRMPDEAAIEQAEAEAASAPSEDRAQPAKAVFVRPRVFAPIAEIKPLRPAALTPIAEAKPAQPSALAPKATGADTAAPSFRCGLFSDGELRIERGRDTITFTKTEAAQLWSFLRCSTDVFAEGGA